MRIGIIGAGQIGSTLARVLLKGGQEVMLAATTRERAAAAAAGVPGATSGLAGEAVAFGDVVIVAVPLRAWPGLAQELGTALAGKVVIDTSNISLERDGSVAEAARAAGGSGLYVSSLLPQDVRLAKAFNTLWSVTLSEEARRPGQPVAVPTAADDEATVHTVAEVVRAAGYEPLAAGGMDAVRRFDVGTPAYNKALNAEALRAALAATP